MKAVFAFPFSVLNPRREPNGNADEPPQTSLRSDPAGPRPAAWRYSCVYQVSSGLLSVLCQGLCQGSHNRAKK